MDKIRSKWDFLIQCRPNVKGIIGNAKLIGGHINHNSNHEKIFNFITTKGSFSYVPPLEDFKKVLAQAKKIDKALLLVLFLTGARIGEILNLKWMDITDDYLLLRSRKHKYGDLKTRHIPLSPLLKETLASIPKRSEYVFTNGRTKTRYIYRPSLLKNLCVKAEVKVCNWHSIRALSATVLSDTGTPLKDISEMLGHSNISTTEIYLRSIGLEKAAGKLVEAIQ